MCLEYLKRKFHNGTCATLFFHDGTMKVTRTQTVLQRMKKKLAELWVWMVWNFISTCFTKAPVACLLSLAEGGYNHMGFPSLCARTPSLKPREKKANERLVLISNFILKTKYGFLDYVKMDTE